MLKSVFQWRFKETTKNGLNTDTFNIEYLESMYIFIGVPKLVYDSSNPVTTTNILYYRNTINNVTYIVGNSESNGTTAQPTYYISLGI